MLPTPRLVILRGDLGAGKTTLVRGIAQAIGAPPDEVTSPTFTLVHQYAGRTRQLYHLDLYRLDHEADLVQLGPRRHGSRPHRPHPRRMGEKFPSIAARARGEVVITQGDEPEDRLFHVRML